MRIVKTFESFQEEHDDFKMMPHQAPDPEIMHQQAGGNDHEAHHEVENYMFFGNLETIKRLAEIMLKMDPAKVDEVLKSGHSWAVDHVATSKDDIEEVANFLINEMTEVDESLLNESDSLEIQGLAKRMYNDLKREGKSVKLDYQNDALAAKGVAKYFSRDASGPDKISIAAFPDHMMALTDSKETAQALIDKYSTDNIIGEIRFWPTSYSWSTDGWSANFRIKKREQRSDFNVNRMGWDRKPNSNDRHREMHNGRLMSTPGNVEYMAEGNYTCNECGSAYEASLVSEGDSCECGGKLTKN